MFDDALRLNSVSGIKDDGDEDGISSQNDKEEVDEGRNIEKEGGKMTSQNQYHQDRDEVKDRSSVEATTKNSETTETSTQDFTAETVDKDNDDNNDKDEDNKAKTSIASSLTSENANESEVKIEESSEHSTPS